MYSLLQVCTTLSFTTLTNLTTYLFILLFYYFYLFVPIKIMTFSLKYLNQLFIQILKKTYSS